MYPHIGDLTNLARYPPLKPKIKEDRKMMPRLRISSISPKEKYF
jgi:hypothetical protein